MKRNMFRINLVLLICIVFVSCAWFQVSKYDNMTYASLTYLKIDILNIYENYDSKDSELGWQYLIDKLNLKFDKLIEYESHKEHNTETVEQIKILKRMFNRHVNNKLWNIESRKSYISRMMESFNIAIETELSKNK